MNVVVVDNTISKVIFHFSEEGDKDALEKLSTFVTSDQFIEGKHEKLGYIAAKVRGNKTFYVNYRDVRNRKAANYRAKIFVRAISDFFSYRKHEDDIYESIFDFAFHNSRNIHHAILGSLRKFVRWDEYLHSSDKVAFASEVLASNPYASSRQLVTVLKSLEQVDFEYDVIDFLRPDVELEDKDFTNTRLHTLLMLAFYVFEKDFNDRGIRVKIDPCNHIIRGNFFTLRSAFMLLFENCVKYCMQGSEIKIDFADLANLLKVDIEMMSIVNSDSELSKVFMPHFRSKNANKCSAMGTGLGLYIAHKLFDLNGITVDLRCLDKRNTTTDNIDYCHNIFIVDIPRDRVVS